MSVVRELNGQIKGCIHLMLVSVSSMKGRGLK